MNATVTDAAQKHSAAFLSLIKNPFKFGLFLLKNLPAAYFSGLKIISVNESEAVVSIRYKWFTRNPFRCTYFACLSMAAEMTTGVLAMANTYQRTPSISMLVTGIEGKFYKKAIGVTRFVCKEGNSMQKIIEAVAEGEPQSIKLLSSGFNENNELIAEFWIVWSFKVR